MIDTPYSYIGRGKSVVLYLTVNGDAAQRGSTNNNNNKISTIIGR